MPFDLQIDPLTNDLAFDGRGNIALVSGAELVAQRLRYRLNTQLGEWSFDVRLGVDYRNTVMQKAPDLGAIRAAFIATIATTEGVVAVETFELSLSGRQLRVRFEVLTNEGLTLEAAGETPETGAVALLLLFTTKPGFV